MLDVLSEGISGAQYWFFSFCQLAQNHIMVNLATIVVMGVFAQWLAWMLRLPSILLLLAIGFAAGPGLGIINPDELLGNLLNPIVALSVGIILFEGGLNLKVSDLRHIGRPVWGLITIGVLVTWTFATLFAWLLLPIKFELCLLFGAILTVTGPTVIIPMIRQIKPHPKMASILRWEGILIDPVGATLAVVVFELILLGTFLDVPQTMAYDLGRIFFAGAVSGAVGAGIFYALLRFQFAPEYLHNPMSFAMVLGIFAFSNQIQEESGLFAVTLAGILLGYQKSVPVRHILRFKENLQVLLISVLFILLAARLKIDDLKHIDTSVIAFNLALIFLVRPLAALLSTVGSGLSIREKVFLAFLAPRGIVAASVTSVFAMKLFQAGHLKAPLLIPYMFSVIVISVVFYGLSAGVLARLLGVSQKNPQGTVFLGAHDWAREIALAFKSLGVPVLLIDKNPGNVREAQAAGLPAIENNILSDDIPEELEISSFRRLLCVTSNDAVNALAMVRFQEYFDPLDIFQIQIAPPSPVSQATEFPVRSMSLTGLTFLDFSRRFNRGGKVLHLEKPAWDEMKDRVGDDGKPLLFPLAFLDEQGNVKVVCPGSETFPWKSGMVIALGITSVADASDA